MHANSSLAVMTDNLNATLTELRLGYPSVSETYKTPGMTSHKLKHARACVRGQSFMILAGIITNLLVL